MFGSGSIITKGRFGLPSSGVKKPERSHHSYRSVSTAAGRKFFSANSRADPGGAGSVVAIVGTSFCPSPDKQNPGSPWGESGPAVPPRFARRHAVPHCRANGRTPNGSRATFRTLLAAAHLHPVVRLRYRCGVRTPPGRSRLLKKDSEDGEEHEPGGEPHEDRGRVGRRRSDRGAVGGERRRLIARGRRRDAPARSTVRRALAR